MEIILEQVFMLFALGAIGFTLAKCGIVRSGCAEGLSKLLVYVFLPANTLKTFSRSCTVAYVTEKYPLILFSLGILAVLVALMHFAAKLFTKDRELRPIYEYSLIIPNFGYVGYAFVEALFGASGLLDAMIFALPMLAYTYTVGFCLLSKKRLSLKNLLNPTTVALFVGALLGLTGAGAYLPDPVFSLFEKASACMAPVSMLLVGIVVSEFGILKMLKSPQIYALTACRLFLVPMAIGGALTLFGADPVTIATAVLLYSMPCGLNTVVFVKNAGGDCEPGAGMAFVSNLLACLSIPLICLLFGINV